MHKYIVVTRFSELPRMLITAYSAARARNIFLSIFPDAGLFPADVHVTALDDREDVESL